MTDPFNRVRYFTGQFLREKDFTDEQNYHVGMRQGHNRTLHTPGVIEGMQLGFDAGTDLLRVTQGSALDPRGREILLGQDWSDNVTKYKLATEATRTVVVTFGEDTGEPSPDAPAGARDGIDTRFVPAPRIAVLAPDAAPDADAVVLGRVTIEPTGTIRGTDAGGDGVLRRVAGARGGNMGVVSLDVGGVDLARKPHLSASADGRLDLGGALAATGVVTASAVGIGTGSPAAPLDIEGNGETRVQAILTRGADANFQLQAANGKGNAPGDVQATFGLQYAGAGEVAGFGFIRGGGAQDGALAVRTNRTERLRVDASGNVGIGTATPAHTLDVNGTINAAALMVNGAVIGGTQWASGAGGTLAYDGGRVGIGTGGTAPRATLEVNGPIWSTLDSKGASPNPRDGVFLGTYKDAGLNPGSFPLSLPADAQGVTVTNTTDGAFFGLVTRGASNNDYNAVIAWGDDADDLLQFRHNNTNLITVVPNGNVGIGTATPAHTLDVNGTINATAVLVNGAAVGTGSGPWTVGAGGAISYGAGNVGIGVAAPTKPLEIAAPGGLSINRGEVASTSNEISFADNGQIRSYDNNHRIIFDRGPNILELREYGDILLSANATGSQRTNTMVVHRSGNVGIGTAGTAPRAKLEVSGPIWSTVGSPPHGKPDPRDGVYLGLYKDGNNFAADDFPLRLPVTAQGVTVYRSTDAAFFGLVSRETGNGDNDYNAVIAWGDDPDDLLQFRHNNNTLITVVPNGNVGIGTATPAAPLDIGGNREGNVQAVLTRCADANFQLQAANGKGNASGDTMATFGLQYVGAGEVASFSFMRGGGALDGALGIWVNNAERLHINANGNVEVLTGDLSIRGKVVNTRGDLAEIYVSDVPLEPGDMVSLDPAADRVILSAGPDDETVVGIVSSEPAIVLNAREQAEASGAGRAGYPIALCGRVPCKVTDENGPIRRGDRLTASSKPGHAMRAEPIRVGGEVFFRPGTLIGKALEAHGSGDGTIEVFVTLQ